ncbi:uncharacterized protein PITG_09074 [Phytophthora infestans T30-4]|uniref:Uncharacterized protein n=1 Tax=Phytophthora infestans (strain T30-4) TaxID=403677 RepID=D0NBM6_PHYIT|nr:uncharacterized protein PITG_09074 [Phytophthora infestans T30-4]EEY55181.1 conserved hypothetical protein [Phytophthora infestans T30-4]|eukprot:XP_002903405.1 conserved hypothetical protein [Phytophthora infestans T30-4]
MKKTKGERRSLGLSRWVPKLLNPVEKHRDRVHHKKKKFVFMAHKRPPAIFTDSRRPFVELLARILAFLAPFEPARVTAYVNKSTAVSVGKYYDLYYPPPRPGKYLVHRILESVFPSKVMELLPINDRVRASASCRSFYEASNALPLELDGVRAAKAFLASYEFPRTFRIHKRFKKTPALFFNEVKAEDAVNIVQMLEREGDDDPKDGSDCFAAVQEISFRKVSGLSALKGKYFQQLLQTLLMDHLKLEDQQFKQLAKLWQDACFPRLQRLSLAQNAFSSRFVRDWSWSFNHERFLILQAIDVSSTH